MPAEPGLPLGQSGRRIIWSAYKAHGLDWDGYWVKVPEDADEYRVGVRWIIKYGYAGSIHEGTHAVTEHDDGTISVTPSLVIESGGPDHWHGYLDHGVFAGSFTKAAA